LLLDFRAPSDDVAIAEAGQGTIRMFVPTPNTARRSFTVWRNNGGSSSQWQWQMENETISLPSGSLLMGAVGRHLLLYHVGSSSIRRGCYTRGVDTFQFERVCGSASLPKPSHVYCNFPPSLLSSPRVSSGKLSVECQKPPSLHITTTQLTVQILIIFICYLP
uniref:Uncharacterized protein n=1 Tax=Aegilops tauschii subsp. strangulata TaxID=200361 RepID=A0A453DEJ9_AEGTS